MALFQSTQPEWAATIQGVWINELGEIFQSTQPEWAATKGSDKMNLAKLFQSTQPEWAATCELSLL